jgi:hypothetical protein
MNTDEYLGLELGEAEELLKSRGIVYRVDLIAPFYKGQPKPMEEGDFRIVRVVYSEGAMELTACRIPGSSGLR